MFESNLRTTFYEIIYSISPIVQMKKLRLNEVTSLGQVLRISKRQSRNPSQCLLEPEKVICSLLLSKVCLSLARLLPGCSTKFCLNFHLSVLPPDCLATTNEFMYPQSILSLPHSHSLLLCLYGSLSVARLPHGKGFD